MTDIIRGYPWTRIFLPLLEDTFTK